MTSSALSAAVRVRERYARIYAPLMVAAVPLPFLHLFKDVRRGGLVVRYGTEFDLARVPNGGAAILGLVLVGLLLALLAVAALRRPMAPSAVLPASIAGIALLVALMLTTRAGFTTPLPELSEAGVTGLVLAVVTVLVGTGDAVETVIRNHRVRMGTTAGPVAAKP